VELTQSDSELARERIRRKKVSVGPKCLSGFVLKSSAVTDDPKTWETAETSWKKYYAVASGSILVVSDPKTFMLDQRLKLLRSKIREVRLRGRGVLFINLHNEESGFLLR
jgi:hypothetical protein